jgi:hypothetical protein
LDEFAKQNEVRITRKLLQYMWQIHGMKVNKLTWGGLTGSQEAKRYTDGEDGDIRPNTVRSQQKS